MKLNHRKNIYYWKSDRPYADGNLQDPDNATLQQLEESLRSYLVSHFKKNLVSLTPAGGRGNHITYLASYAEETFFIRVENGPEKDDYMNVESCVLQKVHALGIPSPRVFHSDNTRLQAPFAIQVIEYIKSSDLNVLEKKGKLNLPVIAKSIGAYVARWQQITTPGFGLFDPSILAEKNMLEGFHKTYRDYFLLNWDTHLNYLQTALFLDARLAAEIRELVSHFHNQLEIAQGCLVHKDLALWNILGNSNQVHAFIDWSDAISGDDMDDISLLGCFHTGEIVTAAMQGYATVKPLPDHYETKFWLNMLRNIIFKAVIRVKGNYFNKPDVFFVNNSDSRDLKAFTLERITNACEGLQGKKSIEDLN